MSFSNPEPGDTTPRDGTRPGDAQKAYGASELRAGDTTPRDHARPADRRDPGTLDREIRPDPSENNAAGVHFSAPFIKRPVATFLLSAAILLAGAVGYKLLPVASLPQVEFPVISVGASLPGADPETMASSVATPLERQFSKIAGINEMTSSSSTGTASVTMQFDLTRDVNGAARDVQAAINAAPYSRAHVRYRRYSADLRRLRQHPRSEDRSGPGCRADLLRREREARRSHRSQPYAAKRKWCGARSFASRRCLRQR